MRIHIWNMVQIFDQIYQCFFISMSRTRNGRWPGSGSWNPKNFKMKPGTRPGNRIKLDREYDQIFLISFLTKNSRATESASLFDILSGHYFFKIFNIPSNLLLKPDLENLRAFRKLFFEEKKVIYIDCYIFR